METSVYFWHVLRTAQKKNLRVGSTDTEGFLCSACLKSEVCRRWKARQVLVAGLHESGSAAGIGTTQCLRAPGSVRAQKWGCFSPADPISRLERFGQALFQEGNKEFVCNCPSLGWQTLLFQMLFPHSVLDAEILETKNSFYCSHPKRWHLASPCSWLLALEHVHGYCCLRNYCCIQVTSLKGHWAGLEQHSQW